MAQEEENEDVYRDILSRLENDFNRSIDPLSILPILFSNNVVSDVQRDKIQTAMSVSRYEACSLLTDVVRRLPKGTRTVAIFHQALLKAGGHENIAEKIRKGQLFQLFLHHHHTGIEISCAMNHRQLYNT